MIPYVQLDGVYTLRDRELIDIWDEATRAGIVQTVFHDGKTRDTEAWIKLCKNPKNILHVIKDGDAVAMVAWLNNINTTYANMHFFVMPSYWGKHTKELATMCLDYWFKFEKDGKPILDVLLGNTPSDHREITIFLIKMKMKILGEIPLFDYDFYKQKKIGVMISYITREEFEHGKRQ